MTNRSDIPREGWITFRDHQFNQIVTQVPDYSYLEDPFDRFSSSVALVGQVLPSILIDSANHGKHNVYRHRDQSGRLPQRTDHGVCPAQHLSQIWLQGVGLALEMNQEAIGQILTPEVSRK